MLLRRLALGLPFLALLGAGPKPEPYGPPVPPTPFDVCELAMERSRAPGVPPTLLPAIGRVESGRFDPAKARVRAWPWTINVEGQGAYFNTKEDAIAAVEAIQSRGHRSIDVGCMQVNLMYHPNAFPDLATAFDPDANAAYASRFLLTLFGQTKDWNLATAWYHSQVQERGEDYQRRVFGRVMTPMGPAKLPATPPGQFGAFLPNAEMFAAIPPDSAKFGAFAPPRPDVPRQATTRR